MAHVVAVVALASACGSTVVVGGTGDGGSAANGPGSGAGASDGSSSGTGTSGTGTGTGSAGGSGGGPEAEICGPCDCWQPSPEPATGDVTLEPVLADGELSGHAVSNGAANVKGAHLFVGMVEGTDYFETTGLMTFELTALPPDAEIVSAHLEAYQQAWGGPVYQAPMTQVVVESVQVPSVWGVDTVSAEPEVDPVSLSTGPGEGWRQADVTALVRRDRAHCRIDSQFRLRFDPSNAPEVSTHAVARFGSVSSTNPPLEQAPRLVITYRTGIPLQPDCGLLEAQLDDAIMAAQFCISSLGYLCNDGSWVVDKCGCPVVTGGTSSESTSVSEAEKASAAWTYFGCGPLDCDSCPPGPEDGPFTCEEATGTCVPQ